MRRLIARFLHEDEGQDLIEYAFLAAFIALAATLAIQTVGTTVNSQYNNINQQLGT